MTEEKRRRNAIPKVYVETSVISYLTDPMRAVDDVIHIGDAEPIDDGGNLRQRGACAFTIQTGCVRNDAGRQREMTACGFACKDDAIRIDVVGLRLIRDLPERAQAVFDGRRRNRQTGETIFDVHDVPSHFQPRDERHQGSFFRAGGPETSVHVNDGRLRIGRIAAFVDVELCFVAACGQVGQIWKYLVLIRRVDGPICGW